MVAGQRGGVLREVVDEGRRPQLGGDELLEDVFNNLAGHGVVVDLQADALRVLDEGLARRLHRDLLAQGLGGGAVQVDAIPLPRQVVLGAVGQTHDFLALGQVEGVARGLLDEVAGQVGHAVVVRVGLVGLQGRKLGAVRGIHALVAEVAVHLEDAVHAADNRALEVDLRGDTQVEIGVERVHVRREGAGSRATVNHLQHRRLELDVVAAEEVLADRAVDGRADADHVARGGARDQVELAAADALVLGQGDLFAVLGGPGLGQGADRLGGDGPRGVGGGQRGGRGVVLGLGLGRDFGGGREDRQLAAARGDHAAVDEEVIAQVDVVLVGGQGLGADGGGGEHDLDLVAFAVHEGREAELAAVAREDDAARQAHVVLGLFAGLEVGVLLAHRLDGGRDRQAHGVGGDAGLHEARALGRANLDLLGGVVCGCLRGRGRRIGHAPIVPGFSPATRQGPGWAPHASRRSAA